MSLVRLLQLASPTLPVGAYSYSGGLEAAVEAGAVHDAQSAERWIRDVLEHSIASFDAAIVSLLVRFPERQRPLNDACLAARETAELRAETVQMGYSLCRLLRDLGLEGVPEGEVAFPAAFAFAARAWGIAAPDAVQAYLWGWVENQVMAAVKAVPLGQTEGQKMLLAIGTTLAPLAASAGTLEEEGLGNFAPALAILSTHHETQYSRLFRS